MSKSTAASTAGASWTLARRADRMNPSVIREILKITERPGIISFAGGLPSPKTFPVAEFASACASSAAWIVTGCACTSSARRDVAGL